MMWGTGKTVVSSQWFENSGVALLYMGHCDRIPHTVLKQNMEVELSEVLGSSKDILFGLQMVTFLPYTHQAKRKRK